MADFTGVLEWTERKYWLIILTGVARHAVPAQRPRNLEHHRRFCGPENRSRYDAAEPQTGLLNFITSTAMPGARKVDGSSPLPARVGQVVP